MVRVSNFEIFSNFGLTKNLKSFFICPVSSDILTLEKKSFFFIKAHFLSLPGISDYEVYDWPYHKPSKIITVSQA